MKQNIDICKSLEEFCLKKLKCQNKCKKMKNSCEKNLSSGCEVTKRKKKEIVKPQVVKTATVKPQVVKTATVKPQEVVKTATVDPKVVKTATVKPQEIVKTATVKPQEIVKTVTVKPQEIVKIATVKLQEDINAIIAKNEISKKEERYVEKVFKNLGVDYKNCDSLLDYKELLRKKCIKFLGYQSDTKKQERCIATRFRWLMEANPDLEKSLSTLKCKIPV